MERKRFLGIITKDVVTASEEDSARNVTCLMKKNDIGAIVVMRDGKVTGIVSETDIARRVVAEGLSPDDTLVKDFMTKDILSVQIKDGLNKVYQTLCEMDFKHLLIMDQHKLVGITSRKDLLDVLTGKNRTPVL